MARESQNTMTKVAHTECVQTLERAVSGLEQEVKAQKRFLERVQKAGDTDQAVEGMKAALGSIDRISIDRCSTGDILTALVSLAASPVDLKEIQ